MLKKIDTETVEQEISLQDILAKSCPGLISEFFSGKYDNQTVLEFREQHTIRHGCKNQ